MNEPGQSIRLRDWLDSRSPRPPAALSKRLAEVVEDITCNPSEISAVLIGRAEGILAGIGDDRSAATDLLAADALISYAMESATENGEDLESFAAHAASRVAAVKVG